MGHHKSWQNEDGITRYEGRADDVAGTAIGEVAGNALHWRYTLALPVGDDVYHVQFDDRFISKMSMWRSIARN